MMFSNVVLPANDAMLNVPAALARAVYMYEEQTGLLRFIPDQARNGRSKWGSYGMGLEEERDQQIGNGKRNDLASWVMIYGQKVIKKTGAPLSAKNTASSRKDLGRSWEPQAVVMMVVSGQAADNNDDIWMEHLLWEQYRLRVIRKTLSNIHGSIDPTSRALRVDGYIVAVAYFRAGFTPSDYPSRKEWDVRSLIERSACIKCPSVGYQLMTTRRMQHVLFNDPGVLETYCQDQGQAARIRSVLMGRYSLSAVNMNAALVAKAKKHPNKFLLVPASGVGDRITGHGLVDALNMMEPAQLEQYVLEERMQSPVIQSHIMRSGQAASVDIIAKTSFFSCFICDEGRDPGGGGWVNARVGSAVLVFSSDTKIVVNEPAGFLLTARSALDDDLDVANGFEILGSVFLTA